MKKTILIIIASLVCDLSYGQWLPNSDGQGLFSYEPVCNANRNQIRVKLLESTQFLIQTNVQKDTILYAVRFTSTNRLVPPPVTGIAYCEPYVPKELGFFSSYYAKTKNANAIRQGFSQCLFDFNEDGLFDDANGNAFYFPTYATVSKSHQYRYEVVDAAGPPEPGCPRPKTPEGALVVTDQIWNALTEAEHQVLNQNGPVDIVSAREVGIVLNAQQVNESTPGSSAGSVLGESVAGANYIDKSVSNGTYSAKGQLGAQVTGAVVGSMLNTAPRATYITRYTVRTASGEILTTDKISNDLGFTIANGVCVEFPPIEPMAQQVCETTLESLRAKYFQASQPSSTSAQSREARLRELKDLFDRGLLSEKVYLDEQKSILDK